MSSNTLPPSYTKLLGSEPSIAAQYYSSVGPDSLCPQIKSAQILRALNLENPADRSDNEMKSLMFQTVNNLVPEYRSDKFASINTIHRRPDTEALKKSYRLKKSFRAVIWNSLSAEAKLVIF